MRDLLSDVEMKLVVILMKRAMKKNGVNAIKLAKLAGYSEKTVREVVNYGCGMPRKTVSEICAALRIDLAAELGDTRYSEVEAAERLCVECGGYSKHSHGHYVGQYTTVRVAYADPSALKCYRTKITWDDERSRLKFEESERGDDFGQSGDIYISPGSAYLSLVTINKGWIRTILISQLLYNNKIMRGLILSQYQVAAASYAPICAPIVYLRQSAADPEPPYGEIRPGSERYAKFMHLLEETIHKSFVRLVHPSPTMPISESFLGNDSG